MGESECFRIDSRARRDCVMSPCIFNVYIDTILKRVKWGWGRMGVRFLEEGRE